MIKVDLKGPFPVTDLISQIRQLLMSYLTRIQQPRYPMVLKCSENLNVLIDNKSLDSTTVGSNHNSILGDRAKSSTPFQENSCKPID